MSEKNVPYVASKAELLDQLSANQRWSNVLMQGVVRAVLIEDTRALWDKTYLSALAAAERREINDKLTIIMQNQNRAMMRGWEDDILDHGY